MFMTKNQNMRQNDNDISALTLWQSVSMTKWHRQLDADISALTT